MDKTLLRPLFKKRYMELHPPVHFDNGGIANNIKLAQATAQNLPQLTPVPIVPVKKQDLVSPEIINPLVEGFEESNKETQVKKNVEAIQEGIKKGEGILSITPQKKEEVPGEDDQLSPELRKELMKLSQQEQILKASSDITQRPASEPLFSDKEKMGIFAALLSQGLARPGPITETLGPALSGAALGLADLKSTEAEYEKNQIELSKTKAAVDSTTDEDVFVTETQIQTVMNPDGSPRYRPKGTDSKSMSVGTFKVRQDDGTYKMQSVPKFLVAKAFLAGDEDKYLPVDKESGETSKTVMLRKEYGGLKAGSFFLVKESELQKDLDRAPEDRIFGAAKLSQNQIAEGLLLSEQVKLRMKKQAEIGNEMNRAEPVVDLINDINTQLKFAKAGSIGSIARGLGKIRSLSNFISGEEKVDANFNDNYSAVKTAIENPEAYADANNLKEGSKERDEFLNVASLFKKETQAMSAELRTNIIELAYAVAKSREEGGRFSVSDIQLALDSINAGIDTNQFQASLRALGRRVLRQPILNYRRFYQNDKEALKGEQYLKFNKALEEFTGRKSKDIDFDEKGYFD